MTNKTLYLTIVSPEGISYEGEVDELIVNTSQGEIAILPHHANLFTKLVEGEAIIKHAGKSTSFVLTGGFVEVIDNNVSVISDFASKAENIEIAKVEAAKKRAEEILAGKISTEDFTYAEKELEKSILTLKVAEKIRHRNKVS